MRGQRIKTFRRVKKLEIRNNKERIEEIVRVQITIAQAENA